MGSVRISTSIVLISFMFVYYYYFFSDVQFLFVVEAQNYVFFQSNILGPSLLVELTQNSLNRWYNLGFQSSLYCLQIGKMAQSLRTTDTTFYVSAFLLHAEVIRAN